MQNRSWQVPQAKAFKMKDVAIIENKDLSEKEHDRLTEILKRSESEFDKEVDRISHMQTSPGAEIREISC